MPIQLYVMACTNLTPEVRTAVQGTSVKVKSFPARCGQPPLAPEELGALLKEEQTFILGSHCLQAIKPELLGPQHRLHKLEQCFYLLCNPTLVQNLQQEGAYLLSPGWLAQWRQRLDVWGFDQATAGEFFRTSIKKIVLLDTGTDPQVEEHLQDFADYLKLPAERLALGCDYTELFLEKLLQQQQQQQEAQEREGLRQQAASAAMALDLLSLVTKAKSIPEVFAAIERLFTMLFAPQRISCLPVSKKRIHSERLEELPPEERRWLEDIHRQEARRPYHLHPNDQGFVLRVGRGEKTLAWVMVLEVAFPQYLSSYLNTSLHVTEVCALAIEHTKILKKLLDTSWLAGKAEVATEVLHNVGNTLNSISVASERIQEIVEQSCWRTLPGIVHLLEEQKEDLGTFFATNPKAHKLPLYFAQLSQRVADEQQRLLEEVRHQFRQIRQTSEIIRRQQDAAKKPRLVEQIDFPGLIEEGLELFAQKIAKQQIEVQRSYAPLPLLCSDRHKIFQIIGNIIGNAVDAFDGLEQEKKNITLRLYAQGGKNREPERIIVEVADNGKGMDQDTLEQVFVFGFTTKEGGHGFGLHNAANLSTELEGQLRGSSLGIGQGAVFRIELPVGHEKY